MRAALRDKRRATAIEREVEITLLRAAAMDVWNAVPLGVVLPPEYVQAINRLGCAIRGEWHLLDGKAPSAPEPLEGDSQVAPPPRSGFLGHLRAKPRAAVRTSARTRPNTTSIRAHDRPRHNPGRRDHRPGPRAPHGGAPGEHGHGRRQHRRRRTG